MAPWKPNGNVKECAAKWDANPGRATLFLQQLIEMRNLGKYRGSPTVSVYNELAQLFWSRFGLYHTPKQFKNYYQNRKAYYTNICWALDKTGIGWDEGRKMILAEDSWWEDNEGRKGLMALRNKSIPDYDLLCTLFAGQRANTDHCYGPFQPIPLNGDEGSGDSDGRDDNQFLDPQIDDLTVTDNVAMSTSSRSKRAGQGGTKEAAKKKKKTDPSGLSPYSAKMSKRFEIFIDAKERCRRKMFDSGNDGLTSAQGSVGPSGKTINSQPTMARCVKHLTDVLEISVDSDLFFYGVSIFGENPEFQHVFLNITNPQQQLRWLERMVRAKHPQVVLPTTNTRYDLNQPPSEDV